MDGIKDILMYFGIGILAVVARLLLALEKITVYSFFRVAITGALIGLALGLGLVENTTMDPAYKYIVFGIAVSLAEDIIAGILNVGKQFRNNPEAFIALFRRK